MAAEFFGSARAIDTARLGPRKEGFIQADIVVDTNKTFPRVVVNIPTFNYEQLNEILVGMNPEAGKYIQTMVSKVTRDAYTIDVKNEGNKVIEMISPAGLLSYRLILTLIMNG